MSAAPSAAPPLPERPPRDDWRRLLTVYALVSTVEGLGVSQVYAFLPAALAGMGVPDPERYRIVGLLGSLIFVLGTPLVPLWGVWADKYSRTAVIVRSSLVLVAVLLGVALSRTAWQLAASMLLIGLQFGNTGVMLAAIRDATPRRSLGRAIAVFGASGPIGFALGPALGGVIVDGLGLGLPAVFGTSAALTLGVALLAAFGVPEVRPEVVPTGSTLRLAYGAVRGVLADGRVRAIFGTFALVILANQVSRAYLPILVEGLVPPGGLLASSIALVSGAAALTGAVVSPLGGALGDRIGFRPVLLGALAGGVVALVAMPFAASVGALALTALVLSAMYGVTSAMTFGLVATEVAPERRSATLNLVYLPLYLAGMVGPATGALVVSATGIRGPFLLGAASFASAAALVALRVRRGG